TDARFADEQSENRLPPQLAALLHGQTLFTNLEMMPALMLPIAGSLACETWRKEHDGEDPHPLPVKTVPAHHARVFIASEGDVAEIFGRKEEKGNFIIGTTLEQGHPICINLDKFVQRSSGIFGTTGSGKSFLTRMILAGLINYNKASVMVFDMHNEYGLDDTASDTNQRIVGLQSKFGRSRVKIVGLGRGASIRGQNPDFTLEIAEKDIQPEDIEMLSRELNLKETTSTTLDALINTFGKNTWYQEFKNMRVGAVVLDEENGKRIPAPDSVAAWANSNGANPMAAEGLHNKLGRLFNKKYIVEQPAVDSVQEIIKALENGQHIILSFGEHQSDLDYLLVSNLLTRRIRAAWEQRTDEFRSKSSSGKEPRPLVIAIEEAHKLLNREMASQTSFSTIAREMRKYYVTLLIVDQRPSQIYDEVLSQLGTRISASLGDDDDIQAVLAGLAGRETLRGMLAHLQPKEEVLLLGWGVAMPIPVRSRRYDENFWRDLLGERTGLERKSDGADILKQLGY
ncbi:MAG: ATP-binding protein, partial [Anaerolineae bacterium]|nr:ATP-binding protein [Anaerolineae bacterium]